MYRFLVGLIMCLVAATTYAQNVNLIGESSEQWKHNSSTKVLKHTLKSLAFQSEAGAIVYRVLPKELNSDLTSYKVVIFDIKNDSEQNADFEIQWVESDGKAKFWRRVQMPAGESRKIELPLRWMRFAGKRVPRYNKIKFFGIYGRSALSLSIKNIYLKPGKGETPTLASTQELLDLAFGIGNGVGVDKKHIRVLVEDPELGADAIANHLEKVHKKMAALFPFYIEDKHVKPTLVVFKKRVDYQLFVPRFAKKLNASAAMPSSGGYAFHALATSYFLPEFGPKRPVYTHEFVHMWMKFRLGFYGGSGDWLQEGIASWIQLQYFPQDSMSAIYANGIKNKKSHTPLGSLLSGKRIPISRYWQAVTVIDWLHTSIDGEWEPIMKDFISQGTEDSLSIISNHLDMSPKNAEANWYLHVKKMANKDT